LGGAACGRLRLSFFFSLFDSSGLDERVSLKSNALVSGALAGDWASRLRFNFFLSLFDINGDDTIAASLKLKALATLPGPRSFTLLVLVRLESSRDGDASS
jgi:hypothetical protein